MNSQAMKSLQWKKITMQKLLKTFQSRMCLLNPEQHKIRMIHIYVSRSKQSQEEKKVLT